MKQQLGLGAAARRALATAGIILGLGVGPVVAAPYTLTTGTGDGRLTVGVDGYGAYGSAQGANSDLASYDPVGSVAQASTTYQSYLALRVGTTGVRTELSSSSLTTNPTVTGTTTSGSSSFTQAGIAFVLTQTVTPTFDALSNITGSRLTQTYTMTNTTAAAISFELVRYVDGDLLFDGSLTDGGGRLGSGADLILFETDSATGASTSTTFVGISASGGTSPTSNRYEIASFSGLRGRILAGTDLTDTISGDGNNDGFIDANAGYDVTLALRNTFTLGVGGVTTYTATTYFGSGTPASVAVPEPASAALMGLGLTGLVGACRRRRRHAS